MKNRLGWVDWVKVIAIFLVMVGHCWMAPDAIQQYLGAIHMPAFFIVSGYLYKPRPFFASLVSFGVPLLFFSTITIFYKYVLGEYSNFIDYWNNLKIFGYSFNTGQCCFTGVWFVQALFVCRLLLGDFFGFSWIRMHYKPIAIIIFISIGILSCFYKSYFGYFFEFAIPAFPFIAMGMYLKERNFDPSQVSWKYAIMSLVVFFITVRFNCNNSFLWAHFGKTFFFYYLSACCGTVFLMKLGSSLGANDFIRTISSGTLMILPLHPWMFWTLTLLLPGKFYDYEYLICPFLLLFIFYPIIKICLLFCPLILGKLNKKLFA